MKSSPRVQNQTWAGKSISKLEERIFEIIEFKEEKRMKKNEQSLRDLWDTIVWMSIHIVGVSEREKWAEWAERIFKEIMA